jgi:hypothetical protein
MHWRNAKTAFFTAPRKQENACGIQETTIGNIPFSVDWRIFCGKQA